MTLLPDPWWLSAGLAALLLSDAVASLRPPRFIRACLDGVGFPREWWWSLIVIKTAAAAGLIVGIWLPGVGLATNAAVVVYFGAAGYAHLRAGFLGSAFWVNCLGMLLLASLALVFGFQLRV